MRPASVSYHAGRSGVKLLSTAAAPDRPAAPLSQGLETMTRYSIVGATGTVGTPLLHSLAGLIAAGDSIQAITSDRAKAGRSVDGVHFGRTRKWFKKFRKNLRYIKNVYD